MHRDNHKALLVECLERFEAEYGSQMTSLGPNFQSFMKRLRVAVHEEPLVSEDTLDAYNEERLVSKFDKESL